SGVQTGVIRSAPSTGWGRTAPAFELPRMPKPSASTAMARCRIAPPEGVEIRVRSWASMRRRSRQRAKPYPARYALPRRLPRVTAPLRETEPKLNLLLPAALAASRMPFSAMDSRASAAPYFRFIDAPKVGDLRAAMVPD